MTNMAAKGYPAAPVGGGLYFNGATGAGNYIGVPYNSQFSGTNDLTVSAWVYFPSGFTASSIAQKSDIFSLEPERRKPGLAGRLRLHRGAVQLDDVFDRRGL